MAKIQGIVGGLSGKMGNAVFRQRYGQTIVAQYQPVVSNPNSPAQQTARAAFKLITQLAAIMAPGFGSFIIKTRAEKGSKRNAFVAKNYGLITADPSPEAAEKVTIPMEKLQLTESFRPLGTIEVGDLETSPNVHIEVASTDIKSVRIVVVGYVETENGSQAAVQSITDVPVTNSAVDLPLLVNAGENATILAYGLIPGAEALRKVDFENIHTPADEDFISAVSLEKMVRDGEMSVTMTNGVNVTIPED